jgi:hypothetical protein
MSLNTVRSAIEGRIATEFANAPVIQVSYGNVPFTPPNNSSFIQVFVGFGDQRYITLTSPASGINAVNGAITANIFTPRGAGAGANLTIAQRFVDLFSRLYLSNIRFDAANGPSAVEASVNETGISAQTALAASFYQSQVTISFEAFEQS